MGVWIFVPKERVKPIHSNRHGMGSGIIRLTQTPFPSPSQCANIQKLFLHSTTSTHSIILFLLVAALSALSAFNSLASIFPSGLSPISSALALRSILLELGGNPFFSFKLTDLAAALPVTLFPKLVVLELLTFPLPVRLCSVVSGGTEDDMVECRRAFRAALASSVIRVRGLVVVSAGEESVKSKMARLSSCFAVEGLVFGGSTVLFDALDAGTAGFLFAVLVSLIRADMAFEAVETFTSTVSDAGDDFDSLSVSLLSSFCLSGLPISASSSRGRPLIADTGLQPSCSLGSRSTEGLPDVEGATCGSTLVLRPTIASTNLASGRRIFVCKLGSL